MNGNVSVREKVKLFPFKPGVYIFYDKNNSVIYVGKAKVLFNRVTSYFVNTRSHSAKTLKLVNSICDVKCIVTESETEALILENQLIKLHSPKYNIKLKDDKNYPYIKLNIDEAYPSIEMVRKRSSDKGKKMYFGPYPNAKVANKIIEITNELFSLKRCKKTFAHNNSENKPCIYYQMDKCKGICANRISTEEYGEIIKEVISFLKQDYHSITLQMKNKMNLCAENFEFEKAAKYRDIISAIQKLDEHQAIQFDPSLNVDVFGAFADDLSSCISVLSVRNGRVTDNKCFSLGKDEILDKHTFPSLVLEFYNAQSFIPPMIFVDNGLYDKEELECLELYDSGKAKKVRISSFIRGEKYNLIKMAQRNAYEYEERRRKSDKDNQEILHLLAKTLRLEVVPSEIEAYDISNSGNDHITGGMIRISNGNFDKKNYRSFNIEINSTNDYFSMANVIERRVRKAIENDASFVKLPDLFLIDGGVGHVNTVKEVLKEYALDYIPVIGMVKDEFHKTRCLTDGENDISIAQNSALFSFFYKIQEEVHRYTFKKMDNKRRKGMKKTVLEDINGIGKQKATALIKHFKSIKAIKAATLDSLMRAPCITRRDAENILEYFKEA